MLMTTMKFSFSNKIKRELFLAVLVLWYVCTSTTVTHAFKRRKLETSRECYVMFWTNPKSSKLKKKAVQTNKFCLTWPEIVEPTIQGYSPWQHQRWLRRTKFTFICPVRTFAGIYTTYQEQWSIGTNSESDGKRKVHAVDTYWWWGGGGRVTHGILLLHVKCKFVGAVTAIALLKWYVW